MTKLQVLEVINAEPSKMIEARDHVFHNKLFVAVYGNMMKFFKTSRSANTYVTKENGRSWYDDYGQKMISNHYEVFEIKEDEIKDVSTDRNFWDNFLSKNMTQINRYGMSSTVEEYANKMIIETELLEVVIVAIKEIEKDYTHTCFGVSEDAKEIEPVAEEVQPVAEVEEVAQQPAEAKTGVSVEVNYNQEKNGIELKFTDKPSEEVRANLKSNGFRWSKFNSVWYAKDTQDTMDFVNSFFNTDNQNESTEAATEPQEVAYPEIEINDIETYIVSQELSKRENDGHWVFRSQERDHQAEIQRTLQGMNDEVMEIIEGVEDAKILYNAKRWLQSYKTRYFDWYMKKLRQDANNPSWTTTGRDGRNRNKDSKYMNAHDKLMSQYVKELQPEYTNKINSIRSQVKKIERQKEANELLEAIKQAEPIKVTRTKGIVNYHARADQDIFTGGTVETTIYKYNEYAIVKTWGSWRIYKNGIELDNDRYATLDTAKQVLSAKVAA